MNFYRKFAITVLAAITLLASVYFLFSLVDDEVAESHESYAEAVDERLFERGWLPSIIPKSSFDIECLNDLDLNTSTVQIARESFGSIHPAVTCEVRI